MQMAAFSNFFIYSVLAFASMVIHPGNAEVPLHAVLPAVQLPTNGSGEAVAGLGALGLRILGRFGLFWPHWRLLFIIGHDVLS
jgi:hypothetical protein